MQAVIAEHSELKASGRPDVPPRDLPRRLLHGYLHKTSNCLCGIKGYASMIAADCNPDIPTRAWAKRIIDEVELMERVYRSLQEIAFPLRHVPRGDDLATVIRLAVGAAGACHPNLVIRPHLGASGALLLPARDLELVVAELLANCSESGSGDDPQVSVAVVTKVCSAGYIKLTVRDDGCGLPGELLADAANPFVTTKDGHLGIGLARVDTIMDMYGLPWSIDSRQDCGTSIELKVASACGRRVAAKPQREEGLGDGE